MLFRPTAKSCRDVNLGEVLPTGQATSSYNIWSRQVSNVNSELKQSRRTQDEECVCVCACARACVYICLHSYPFHTRISSEAVAVIGRRRVKKEPLSFFKPRTLRCIMKQRHMPIIKQQSCTLPRKTSLGISVCAAIPRPVRMCVRVCRYARMYICVRMHVCVYVNMYACMYDVCMYLFMYVCMLVCMHVCVYGRKHTYYMHA